MLLSIICSGTSSITSLERYSSTGGLQVLQVTLESNSTGYVSLTAPTIMGRLYAIDWYSASSLADDNTIFINATAPYTRTIASYNMTADQQNTTYPLNGTNEFALRTPLTFEKANATSEMDATLYLYLYR